MYTSSSCGLEKFHDEYGIKTALYFLF